MGRGAPARARFDSSDPLSWAVSRDGVDDDDLSIGALSEAGDRQRPLQQLTEAELDFLLQQPVVTMLSSAASSETDTSQPATAAQSIGAGLLDFKAGRYESALRYFRDAESLPGSGVLRVRGRARDLSDGERQAARYNAAAALVKLGQLDEALAQLRLLLDAGFDDGTQLQRDSDFAELRSGRPAEWGVVVGPITRAPGPFDWLFKA